MHIQPIDLAALAGKRYQTTWDEARQGRESSAWLVIVPCRLGHLYPHSATQIGVATNTRETGRKIARLPGAEFWQDGDDGMNVICPAKMFGQVARLMGARRRRQVSEKERQRHAAMGKATRLKPKLAGVEVALQRAQGTKSGLDVSQAV